MEILWWWAPAVAVTLLAVLWVSWYGRTRRREVDREQAVEQLGRALQRPSVRPAERPERSRDRSSGIAVRPARPGRDGDDEPRGRA